MAERGSSDSRSIPGNARDNQFAEPISVQTEVVGFTWSAPLPTPADLGEYERLVPGSALRILTMTEKLDLRVSGAAQGSQGPAVIGMPRAATSTLTWVLSRGSTRSGSSAPSLAIRARRSGAVKPMRDLAT